MEIIKRYIYSIQRRLPMKGKEDIAKEINSLIFDELEGTYGKREEYTNEQVEAVLKEMGHPREVAARYRGDKQLLIGPELFPIYKMVIAIVIGAVTLGLVISFIVQSVTSAVDGISGLWFYFSSFAQLFATLFSTLLSVVGSITIVFALIEHFGKFTEKDIKMFEDWKPKDLPELPNENERVRMWEPIVAMCVIVLGFTWLNFYFASHGSIPFMINPDASTALIPIFDVVVLREYLILWNLSLAMSFGLQLALLKQGKWQLGTRLFEVLISLLGIVILAKMYNGEMLVALDGIIAQFGHHNWMDTFQKYYYIGIKVLIFLSSFGVVINIIKLVFQQARKANV